MGHQSPCLTGSVSDRLSRGDIRSLSEGLLEAVPPGTDRVEHLRAHGKYSIDVYMNVPMDVSPSWPGRMALGL